MLKHFKIDKSLDLQIPTVDQMVNELLDSGFPPAELSKLTVDAIAKLHELKEQLDNIKEETA